MTTIMITILTDNDDDYDYDFDTWDAGDTDWDSDW